MDPQKLYPHNREAYEAVMEHYVCGHKKACVVHATGTGKSYIIAAVADHFGRTLVVAPNNYVIEQVKSTIADDGVDYITYQQLLKDTDSRKSFRDRYDLVVFDEFHRTGAKRWSEGVQYLMKQNPEACIFGTSATPIRFLDNGRDIAEELFGGQVLSTLTVQDAWVRGILEPPVYILSVEDFNTVRTECIDRINSEYIPKSEKPELLRNLQTAQQLWELSGGVPGIIRNNIGADISRVIVFCPHIDRIEEDKTTILEWFREAGIPVEDTYVIESSRSERHNMEQMEKFQQDNSRGVKIMISVNMLNEGIHVPRVDALIMLRRTVSMNIYLQQMGRCMAATQDNRKRPVILDLQNNIANVGLHNFFDRMDYEYGLSVHRAGYTGEDRNITVRGVGLDIIHIINDIGSRFEQYRREHNWNSIYAKAKAFYEEYGHFPKFDEDKKIYSWAISWYTYNYLNNPEKNEERAQMLMDIGFAYQNSCDRNDELWMKNYNEATEFVQRNGHFPSYNENRKLYAWAFSWWRNTYLKNPERNARKAELLRELGYIHKILDMNWMENYREAKAFYDEHGYFVKSTRSQKLYDWARNWWKKSYLKNPAENAEKARMLLDIGFEIKLDNDKWMNNFEEAKAFFEEHGHFPSAKEKVKLYNWAKQWWVLSYLNNPETNQRKADMLASIGYAYRSAQKRNDDIWMRNYNEAKDFYDKHGRFPTHGDIEGVKKWARQWWSKVYLKAPEQYREKADMLLAIGFEDKGTERKMKR